MIFNWYSRVVVEIGDDESHVFDHDRLMFTEVAEIEKVTGLSYMEWEQQLRKFSITAVAALVHILRKRAKQPSDFGSMQFNVRELNVWPIHADGTKFTQQEIDEDIARRIKGASEGPDPTLSAADAAAEPGNPEIMSSTSPSSASASASALGNGSTSPGQTSSAASPISTSS